MRIAVLSHHTCPLVGMGRARFGGMNTYLRGMCTALVRAGVEVHLFTRAHDAPHELVEMPPGAKVMHIPTAPSSLAGSIQAFWQGVAQAAAERYALVHGHYWTSGLAGLHLARLWEVPLVVTFHTTALAKRLFLDSRAEPASRWRAERLLARQAQGLTVSSPHEVDLLVKGYGADPHRVVLAPPGVDLERFHPHEGLAARRLFGLPDVPLVVAVGRPDPIKRFPLAVEALAHMEVGHLVIAGEHDGVLRGLAHRLGVAERVHLLGPVAGRAMPHLYAAADVVVVPSAYESFGMVALEGMACGRPVVAARVGGLASLVEHGRTGYLVERGCPQAYALREEALLASPSLRQVMGEQALQRARTFTWDAWVERVLCWYQHLVG
ncbi:MAG: glycosyltransferase [Dehalococcoidia bacterium]|nr:glycosyltransferase [Dehalococcoidia bacterium]MDW8120405.1 glycosyltransferase [Chloroflexota bacterium]